MILVRLRRQPRVSWTTQMQLENIGSFVKVAQRRTVTEHGHQQLCNRDSFRNSVTSDLLSSGSMHAELLL